MKTIVTICRRRRIISIFLIVGIFCAELFRYNIVLAVTDSSTCDNAYFEPKTPSEGSIEEMYKDVFMTMLLPYVQEAVSNYYEKNTGYSPSVDPWQPDILYIRRPNGYRTFMFVIKLEVAPYLGAHNSIGVDHITLRVSSNEVKVEKFEHIKDYPVPPHLRNDNGKYKKLTSVMTDNSIPQKDWGSQNCQERESLLERLIVSTFVPQIIEAVKEYYQEPRGFDNEKILDIKVVGPYRYEMKIQISTFVGAHSPPYGEDVVTIHFRKLCDVKVVNFEHRDEELRVKPQM